MGDSGMPGNQGPTGKTVRKKLLLVFSYKKKKRKCPLFYVFVLQASLIW